MSKINWPLNEPIKTNTRAKYCAYIRIKHPDGTMIGDCFIPGRGYRALVWTSDGKTRDRDECGLDLIPPKPARQYGYAVWEGDQLLVVKQSNNYVNADEYKVVRFPIPRPGEELCVRPSREAVADAIRSVSTSIVPKSVIVCPNSAADAILALLDECC